MKQNRRKLNNGKLRKSAETRTMHASRFRVLCADAGLSIDQVAQLLHVTPRTVRYWFSAQTQVPYAAYKLLRILRLFELPGKGFEGWCMHSGKLWTPEGVPIAPEDGGWWSLLVRRAACFGTLYQQRIDLDKALSIVDPQGRSRRPDGDPLAGKVRAAAQTSQPSPMVITGITDGVTTVTGVAHG